MKKILNYLFLIFLLSATSLSGFSQEGNFHTFHVKIDHSGAAIPNMADNMNAWNYVQDWHGAMEKEPEDYFSRELPFVRFVQLMTAAGGNEQRDLFKNPLDRTVMDDYDFSPLLRACRNILRQGLIPHLKLGNVPLKYSKEPQISADFGVNKCPPDDYGLWHSYIRAMMQSLADEFGLQNVRNWRFGVVTEYENKDWFSVGDDPEKTRDAYLTLYDYTVDALEQVLGTQICVGAHSMTVAKGLWDERQLIEHCARGKNRCTGKTGTRLCFLAASYYDIQPGKHSSGLSLEETIDVLRKAAESEGFLNLFYGIDEGRILSGLDGKPIGPRATGYTWQAAYDARLYHKMMDSGIDYFSHWAYTSESVCSGAPSVSAQTAALFYKLAGTIRQPITYKTGGNIEGEETGAICGIDAKQAKLYLLFYAYSDSVHLSGTRKISCTIEGLDNKKLKTNSVRTLISDDSNFFDEWLKDREQWGITADDFGWSSDSFVIKPPTLSNSKFLKAFNDKIPFYQSCAKLKPEQVTLDFGNGVPHIQTEIPLHGVLLWEIDLQ
ncbi:MAG: hypothetical protein FWG22_03270 [Prolixibacteraceae bacterium]|nr:hypothetical protein [Prolixibacteraceae bacterium]